MNRVKGIIVVLLLLIYSCTNNQNKYEREDLVQKYINDHDSIFNKYQDFNLLVIRDMKLRCVEAHMDYFVDEIIVRVRDSLAGTPIIILSDNNYVCFGGKLLYQSKDTHFVFEKTKNIVDYGFLFSPVLFHISHNKIKEWKYMAKLD